MSYARARLLLGMSGVGLIVVSSTLLLLTQYPLSILPTTQEWSKTDLSSLGILLIGLALGLLPLDLLGGYFLPNRWRPNTITGKAFLLAWGRGALVQTALFLMFSLWILLLGRSLGYVGAVLAIISGGVGLICFQLPIARLVGALRMVKPAESADSSKLKETQELLQSQGHDLVPIEILSHQDVGFTGGIVGIPGREKIILPADLVTKLTAEELAIVIARRVEALRSGSRLRGLLLSFAWVIIGFTLSILFPGAGYESVSGLAMACLGFTIWTFLGLLLLPTLSRQASYAIDKRILAAGASTDYFQRAMARLDSFQDDEPERSRWVEAIFHPVPSVANRTSVTSAGEVTEMERPIAWHAARMTLFMSWACMGTLVRAVHCNVGRPELWVMLPTD